MDQRSVRTPSNGKAFGPASSYLCLSDPDTKPWHSTPTPDRKNIVLEDDQIISPNSQCQGAANILRISKDSPSGQLVQGTEFRVNEGSASTIQKQRRELQLLLAELKDRERELNTMAAAHHQQIQAWEKTRQKVLKLEQRCARLDDELQKRNEVIKVLSKRVSVVETREKEVQRVLSETQQELRELAQKDLNMSKRYQDFEEQNKSLNATVMALSTQVGSLQVREEELRSMLKLKDKDVTEASSRLLDLTGRLRDLDMSLTESHSQESKMRRDLEEQKHHYREARREIAELKEALQQQVTQSSTQREEIIRLKQEFQLVSRDLALSGEGDSWKDELLELARSKQKRTMSELSCLRQVCENQRNDIQLLQLNLESARDSLRERISHEIISSHDEFKCDLVNSKSPPSPRLKASENCLETSRKGSADLWSALLTDDFNPPQQHLNEFRHNFSSEDNRHHSFLPLYCQTDHHHSTTSSHKGCDCETPPTAWLHHGTRKPHEHLNTS